MQPLWIPKVKTTGRITKPKELKDYPPVLSVKQIQEILSMGRGQAYILVNSGQFHVVRTGNKIHVSKKVFEDWLNGNLVKS